MGGAELLGKVTGSLGANEFLIVCPSTFLSLKKESFCSIMEGERKTGADGPMVMLPSRLPNLSLSEHNSWNSIHEWFHSEVVAMDGLLWMFLSLLQLRRQSKEP
jgi:hypothetical protein